MFEAGQVHIGVVHLLHDQEGQERRDGEGQGRQAGDHPDQVRFRRLHSLQSSLPLPDHLLSCSLWRAQESEEPRLWQITVEGNSVLPQHMHNGQSYFQIVNNDEIC